jgi:hypothetical protein
MEARRLARWKYLAAIAMEYFLRRSYDPTFDLRATEAPAYNGSSGYRPNLDTEDLDE